MAGGPLRDPHVRRGRCRTGRRRARRGRARRLTSRRRHLHHPARHDARLTFARPTLLRRLAAITAMVLVVGVVVVSIVMVLDKTGPLLGVLALSAVAVAAAWYALTRAHRGRLVAVLLVVAALSVIALTIVAQAEWSLVWRLALLVLAVALARYAIARDVRSLKQSATAGTPVLPARHGVLIMNLKSGGGKAERFHLV